MAHSVNPDQTAPIGAVCSGSKLFACILKFASNVRQLFAADNFSRRHFHMHFSWRFKGLVNLQKTFFLKFLLIEKAGMRETECRKPHRKIKIVSKL